MACEVRRPVAASHGRHEGRPTLRQSFQFSSASAEHVAGTIWAAPLLGEDSIFGHRPSATEESFDGRRTLRGFSPVYGFRFDVTVEHGRSEREILITFSQPEEPRYLVGQALWVLRDDPSGAVLEEEINTARALEAGASPLSGPRPSLRRWMFFRVGHKAVMEEIVRNIASLIPSAT